MTIARGASRALAPPQERLSKLNGEAFDRESMQKIVRERDKDVKEFERQVARAKDADLEEHQAK